MELEQQFAVQHDADTVWEALTDAPFAVQCLPGAELEPSEDNVHYKGKMRIKLGPLSAAFSGDAVVERDDAARKGTVHWTGVDTRSNSRTKATMVYRVTPEESKGGSTVYITADVALTGALAQFGRSGIIQDVANRLTAIFADNLQQRLNERHAQTISTDTQQLDAANSATQSPPRQPAASQELQALPLLWGLFRGRLADMLRRMADWVGGRRSEQ